MAPVLETLRSLASLITLNSSCTVGCSFVCIEFRKTTRLQSLARLWQETGNATIVAKLAKTLNISPAEAESLLEKAGEG